MFNAQAIVLSTDSAPPRERLDYWSAIMCDMLFGFSLASDAPLQFEGRLTASTLDMLLVCDSSGTARMSTRDKRWIAEAPEHVYALLVDFAAPWTFYWRGVPQKMDAGDMVITDTRFEQRADTADRCLMRNIRLPLDWLKSWIADPKQIVGRKISRSSGWGAALSAAVAQLTPGLIAAPPVSGKVLTDHLGSLLSLVYSDFVANPASPHADDLSLVARVRDILKQRLSEVSLSATDVAKELHIEVTALHRVLASQKLLFSVELQGIRIAAAKAMLESPTFDSFTVAEIGRRAGFSDPSRFARVIGKHLGQTPRQIRIERG